MKLFSYYAVYLTLRFGIISWKLTTMGWNKCKRWSRNLSHHLLILKMGSGLWHIERHLTHTENHTSAGICIHAGNIHTSITLHFDVTLVNSDPTVMGTCWFLPHKMNGIYLSKGLPTAFLQQVMVTCNSFCTRNFIIPLTSTDTRNLFKLCLVIARTSHEQT
jgi:hypothetical protein